jgi:VWFA-related protein
MSQQTYSESAGYKPRQFDDSKKESKKKADNSSKTVAPATANVDSEITVTIPFAVLDKAGSAVGGLTSKEVSVFVDDIEVPVSTFEQDKEPVNVILMLDTSPSATLRLQQIQEQAKNFVKALPSETKVMVIDFNAQLKVRSQPTTDRAKTEAAISKIQMAAGTSIYNAIRTVYEKVLPTVSGRKIIVLTTDGVDTTSEKSTWTNSLTEIEKEDVTIYPMYVDTFSDQERLRKSSQDRLNRAFGGLSINSPTLPLSPGSSEAEYKNGLVYLQDLANASGGRVFRNDKLDIATKSILDELANRYYITVKVPRKNAGSRTIRVRINRPSLRVLARGSFVEK